MKRSILFGVVSFMMFSVAACGGGSSEKVVAAFMDKVRAGNVDGAVAMIKNRFDKNVPVKVRRFFAGKTLNSYTLIKDTDSKAGAAGNMGMAMTVVRIRFADGEKTIKFILRKNGGWAIRNILLN